MIVSFHSPFIHAQVASNEEGLRSSWFTGTVLQIVNDQALVRYDELLEDDGELHTLLCPAPYNHE